MSTRIWTGLSWLLTLFFYFPVSQTRAKGAEAIAILKKIDYIGGILSITGLTLL